MKFVFAPAVAVANRLRYTQKFLVAGVLMLISVAVLFGGLYRNLHASMAATQSEMAGISAVTPLLKTIQLLQQHRGLSAGLLGGNPAMRERRAAKEAEVEAAFAATDEQFSATLRSDEGWRAIRAKWSTLKADGLNRSLADNTAFHSALLSDLLIFVGTVSDHYALTLDPDIDSYYLMDTATNRVPLALERLGQMRAMGTGVLAKKAASEAQRIGLSRATGEMQGNMRLLLVNADKVARYNPGLGDVLSTRAQDAAATANDIADVIATDILGGVFATDAQAFFDRATAAIDKGYQLTYEILLPTLAQLLEQRLARDRLHLGLQFGGMSALLLALAYFFAGIYYSITGNVRLLAEEATQVAGGNLSARVRLDSRDELVTVADGFNRMTDAVGDAVRKVMQESARVAEEANRLAGAAAEVATASSHQSESATTMAATVEQVTVSIDVVSKNASDARRVTENSRGASLQGGRLVAQVVHEMESISTTVNQSAQAIRELGEHSQRITTVVGVIREIAEQTNLLALNAAIEAARAGDQGRGFAVVADEVRKLAERTAASTGEIAEMVAAIQGGTAAAVTAMEDGVARVDKGVTLARQAGGSMAAVEQGAEQVMAAVSDISDALKEQSTASLDMARNVERIAQMAEQNSAAVSGAADTARRLEALAQTLRAEVSHFRI